MKHVEEYQQETEHDLSALKSPDIIVLNRFLFDTDKYYFYYTEIKNEGMDDS